MNAISRFMRRLPFPVVVVFIYIWWVFITIPACLLLGIGSGIEMAYNKLQSYNLAIVMANADRKRKPPHV